MPLVFTEGPNGAYDTDGDRLIEISNLEQLDAVRYDLSDGDGRPDDDDNARDYARAFPTSGGESVCDRACRGYELSRSLDFNDPDSYADGAVNPEWDGGDGWLPMTVGSNGLNAQFEGNGHTISNLYIHRQDASYVGLFARVGGSGVIRNLGVVNAEMQGNYYVGILAGLNSGEITGSHATGSVSATNSYVGILAGQNRGEITASYATGSVSGGSSVGGLVGENFNTITASHAISSVSGRNNVGGLVGTTQGECAITDSYAAGSVSATGGSVGYVGGLVGINQRDCAITVSYATGDVTARVDYAGGLVGRNYGTVAAAYATGSVSGRNNVGGLVGNNTSGGVITASYAIGGVSGGSSVGGLVGQNHSSGVITDSYWNTDVFGPGDAGTGHTTAQLQSPTGYTGIYQDWDADVDNADRNDDAATGADDFWDFGSGSQYPALKADLDGDGTATAAEFGGQHGAAPAPMPLVFTEGPNGAYDTDGDRLIEISNLEQLDAVRYDLSDGDGRPDDDDNARDYARAFPTSGGESVCDRACRGYELSRSLDFNDPDSYADGAVNPEWDGGDGWLPMTVGSNGLNAQFEGNGHTISNLYIHRQDASYVGLFARVGGSGVIRNLGVVNAEMQGNYYVGILAGLNSGEITGSHATGSVSATNSYVGILAGQNRGEITASYATGSVSGGSSVGGLVGENFNTITASHAISSVSGRNNVGGLVGTTQGECAITDSYAAGSVSATGGSVGYVGGLVGINQRDCAITVSYATGDVTARVDYAGGLVGRNYGTVAAAYATGSVSGRNNVGGLVGNNTSGGVITASYAIGGVSGGSSVGGLVGQNHSSGVITDSYWNTDVFGPGDAGTGHTTAQLQSPTGYTGIYQDWDADVDNADRNDDAATGADDFWDFGSGSQYPALKADLDGDGTATAAEFGGQGRAAPPMPAGASANRSFSATTVEPGETLTVTIAAANYSDFGAVTETLPAGFTYVSSSLPDAQVAITGQEVKFTLFGDTSFTYTVTASDVDGPHTFSGTLTDSDGTAHTVGGDTTVTVGEAPPAVTVSHAGMDPAAPVRIGAAIPVAATFTKTVTGFTVDDVTVSNASVGNFLGSDAAYTFDVTPNAIGQVTVDITANVAVDADGNGNTAAAQLRLGIPYDDNRNGLIERSEVIKAINDYLGAGSVERSHVIALINLYLSGQSAS